MENATKESESEKIVVEIGGDRCRRSCFETLRTRMQIHTKVYHTRTKSHELITGVARDSPTLHSDTADLTDIAVALLTTIDWGDNNNAAQ